MADPLVVTRFAPSPTGYLHVGGARTALFSWLVARHFGGKFLLRIEDTDLARSTEEATLQLIEDLRWLGLHWDNEKLVYQSKRLDVYNSIIDGLVQRGLAYKAWETSEELDALRKDAEKHKRSFIYRRPALTDEQVRKFESEGRPHVVRFALPVKEYSFEDVVLGPGQGVGPSQVQDFVIRKSDGMPTYHFAVVVDDAEMGVTHVLRGQEHLLNTVNHIGLQDALGYPRPIYGHLPIILNTDGSKMGKRDRDKKVRHATNMWLRNTKKSVEELGTLSGISASRLSAWIGSDGMQLDTPEHAMLMPHIGLKALDLPEILVHDFRASGYLPEVLLNFLSLLGWNPGGDLERMSIDEMIKLFEIKDIGKSNAKFNREKLLSFNTKAAEAAPIDRMVTAMRDYLQVNPESPMNRASDEQLATLIKMKTGLRLLRDVDDSSRFLFMTDEQITYDPQAVEKVLKKQGGFDVLKDLKPILEQLPSWTAGETEKAIEEYCQQKQLGLGKVAQPIRVAVSGGTVSPPIFQSLEFLGRERTLARIGRCLALAS
ncbi:MAG TPA: glutamate--tRNA ligase [Tepidisphaeraceae bacterium]|jgi:glutamyl-tRNA synthetase